MLLTEYQTEKHTGTQTLAEFLDSKKTAGEIEKVVDNGDGTYTITINGYEAVIDSNGELAGEIAKGEQTGGSSGGNTGGGSGGNIISAGEKAEGGNKEYSSDGKTATIPEGFTVSDKKGETSIKGGLVVTAPDGSEFVWIPVNKVEDMAKEIQQSGTETGIDENGNKMYQGKLYDFNSDLTSTEKTSYGQGTPSYREPDVVTDKDKGSYLTDMNSILTTAGITYSDTAAFKSALESDFSKMIDSVSTYHGFYVGRYETSLNETSKAVQSKKGAKSANASDEDTYRWYGLYAKQRLYSTDSVQGSMIWGSQYDAMMRWMQINRIDVTSKTPTDVTGLKASYNNLQSRITGGKNEDKLNNIYDLLGNSYEWTLEAYDTNYRVYRGGSYYDSSSPKSRYYYNPHNDYFYYGSRLTLYVK